MVSVWSAHVAADPAGVPWNQRETGDAGKAADTAEGIHVTAGAGDELRTEGRAHARHAQDDLRVTMLAEAGRDLRVDAGDLFVQGQHRLCQGVHDGRGRGSPVTAVCWACAAATAVSAMVWAPRTLRFFSQVASRLGPTRRRAAGVW